MIPNRIYQVKDTNKYWVYINDLFGFETLDGAPCWWEGEIEFIDTGKNMSDKEPLKEIKENLPFIQNRLTSRENYNGESKGYFKS